MYTGVVAGSVVATVKDSALEGIPLLVVRKMENGKEAGLIVAADQTRQAGIVSLRAVYRPGPKAAARIFRVKRIPVDVAIVGFIDTYHEEL